MIGTLLAPLGFVLVVALIVAGLDKIAPPR